jgi:hypothetical protein
MVNSSGIITLKLMKGQDHERRMTDGGWTVGGSLRRAMDVLPPSHGPSQRHLNSGRRFYMDVAPSGASLARTPLL